MAATPKKAGVAGKVVGLAILAAAVYAVFFVEWKTEPTTEPPPVRPLKTLLIESPLASTGRKYPGKVKAAHEVDLAFQVAGPLIEFPVNKGQEVNEGELLARLDPRDFQNQLDEAQAKLGEAEALWKRMEQLFKDGHAQQVEYEQHKKDYNVAKAAAAQAKKDLDDTNLRAPFAGVIANKFVENFQNVLAKQRVLSLQDVTSVEIEVNVPEERVALSLKNKDRNRLIATFDYLPGREFEVVLKEYATEADPVTQTYAATLIMPAPEDVAILPGMTATVTAYREQPGGAEDSAYAVPIDAVPIDGQGEYHVWLVEKQGTGDNYVVRRKDVKVGEMIGNDILVVDGIKQGDRIATAGVHLLREGQVVRLLASKGGPDTQ